MLNLWPHALTDKAAVLAALNAEKLKADGSTAKLALSFFDLTAAEQAAYATHAYDDAWTAPAYTSRR